MKRKEFQARRQQQYREKHSRVQGLEQTGVVNIHTNNGTWSSVPAFSISIS